MDFKVIFLLSVFQLSAFAFSPWSVVSRISASAFQDFGIRLLSISAFSFLNFCF
jgi:hypothetical protein